MSGVELLGQRDDVFLLLVLVELVEIDPIRRRRGLEERVVVVPGHDRLGLDLESPGQLAVHVALHLGERLGGQPVQLGEDGQQLLRVVLLEPDFHVPVVGVAELPRGLVADLGQFEQLRGDLAADLLQGLPDFLAPGAVGLLAEHLQKVVVRHAAAVDLGADTC